MRMMKERKIKFVTGTRRVIYKTDKAAIEVLVNKLDQLEAQYSPHVVSAAKPASCPYCNPAKGGVSHDGPNHKEKQPTANLQGEVDPEVNSQGEKDPEANRQREAEDEVDMVWVQPPTPQSTGRTFRGLTLKTG